MGAVQRLTLLHGMKKRLSVAEKCKLVLSAKSEWPPKLLRDLAASPYLSVSSLYLAGLDDVKMFMLIYRRSEVYQRRESIAQQKAKQVMQEPAR
jgi:hypothetical protein